MTDCVFCKIVRKELPAAIAYEDEHTLAIMDQGHVNPGHTLVLVKPHYAVMQELPEDLAAAAFRTVFLLLRGAPRLGARLGTPLRGPSRAETRSAWGPVGGSPSAHQAPEARGEARVATRLREALGG